MSKKFIKMNDNKNNLSLGNLVNIIKKYSKVKESSIQHEVFCSLFDIKNINNTTVNNYLIGYRAIGLDYKKMYIDLKEKYSKDNKVFFRILCNVISILDEVIYNLNDISLNIINNNVRLNNVCKDLLKLCKADKSINKNKEKEINLFYSDNNLYECFINILLFVVLEKKQPIYIEDINKYIIKEELDSYLNINLYEGTSYITSLIELGKKDNMYANAELGSLEYSGFINGNVDYEKCYNYYLLSAKKNHPKACFMVANLILKNLVLEKSIDVAWHYLCISVEEGNKAAINKMGLCYLNGNNPNKIIDINKALECFKNASDMGYSYSFNNLGLYFESLNDMNKALYYYKLSSDLNNSWALNKVGEIYRLNSDLKTAYFYYIKSIECPITERYYYAYYNLANYYYLCGNKELGIKKDLNKYSEYISIFNKLKNV